MTNIHAIDYLKNNGLASQDDMAKHKWLLWETFIKSMWFYMIICYFMFYIQDVRNNKQIWIFKLIIMLLIWLDYLQRIII
jgi:hypothetical protein